MLSAKTRIVSPWLSYTTTTNRKWESNSSFSIKYIVAERHVQRVLAPPLNTPILSSQYLHRFSYATKPVRLDYNNGAFLPETTAMFIYRSNQFSNYRWLPSFLDFYCLHVVFLCLSRLLHTQLEHLSLSFLKQVSIVQFIIICKTIR